MNINNINKEGLVSYWSLNKDDLNNAGDIIKDKSGNGNDGMIAVTPASFEKDQNGVPNQAMSFDGVGDYLDFGNTPTQLQNLPEGDFSVSVWVRLNSTPQSVQYYILSNFRYGNCGWYLNYTGYDYFNQTGVFELHVHRDEVAQRVFSDNVVANQEYNLIAIYNSSTGYSNIYINGVLATQSQTQGSGNVGDDSSEPFYLGRGASDRFFNGNISDVAIYNKALSDQEVQQLYKAGRTTAKVKMDASNPNKITPKLQKGLILDMPLAEPYTEANNTIVKDRTPNGNDGIVNGATVKYDGLVNTANGIAYINQDKAYGTWEFDLCHSDTSTTYINFLSNGVEGAYYNNGYQILVSNVESIQFRKTNTDDTNMLFATAASYVSINTDYRIKITRSLAGVFTVYIKGGSFGWDNWTTVGSATDNTYTTSNYFVTDLDSGDSISNLKIDGKKVSLNKATVSSGSFTTTAPSYEFDGTDDYIDLGAEKPTNLTGDITISVWINPNSFGENNYGRIIDNNKFILGNNSEKVFFQSQGSEGTVYNSADNSISLNTWQHILATRNSAGNATNFYINGELSGDANQDSGTPSGAGLTNTFIGNNDAGDRTFDGQISNLKIWNRVLSASEINYLYSKEKINY